VRKVFRAHIESYQEAEVYYIFECAGFEWKFYGKQLQCKGTDVTITEANSRNLLRNLSSSRYKFNAERRLHVNRISYSSNMRVCAKKCVKCKKRKIYNLLHNAVRTTWKCMNNMG